MLKSAIIYFMTFVFSIGLITIYQQSAATSKSYVIEWNGKLYKAARSTNWLYYLLILLPPLFVATVRFGIGTDYLSYLAQVSVVNNQVNLVGLWGTLRETREPLYLLLNYAANLLFPGTVWGIFLLTSLFTLVPVVMTLDYFKQYLSMPMGLFIFYMYYYLVGFNTQRQMLAVSFVFLSFRYLFEKKPMPYFFTIMVATLFHNTAIVCLLFYLLNFGKSKGTLVRDVAFYAIILGSPLLMVPALAVLGRIPAIAFYLGAYNLDFQGFSLFYIADLIPVMIPILFFRSNIKAQDERFEVLLNLSLLLLPLTILTGFQTWAFRLKYYISIVQMLLIPVSIRSVHNKWERTLMYLLFILFYAAYFILLFMFAGSDEAFPYKSFIPFLNSGDMVEYY